MSGIGGSDPTPPVGQTSPAPAASKPASGTSKPASNLTSSRSSFETSRTTTTTGRSSLSRSIGGGTSTASKSLFQRGLDTLTSTSRRVANTVDNAVDNALDTASDGLDTAGRTINRGLDVAGDAINRGLDRAGDAVDRGLDVAGDALQDGLEVAGDALQTGLDTARDGINRAGEAIHDGIEAVDNAVDNVANAGRNAVQGQIEQLDSANDKITVTLGGNASVEGGKVAAKGQAEITRTGDNPPRYTVSVGGEVAGGLAGELGARLGGQASLNGEALLRAGGKVEMTFDSPAEAARAVEIMGRQAAVSAANQAPGPLGFVGGAAADALIGPSQADMNFLNDHFSAVEFKGGVAAEAAGALGLQLDETLKIGGLNLKGQVSEDFGLRVEMPQRDANGQVTQGARVSLSHELAGGISGGGGLGIGDPSQDSGGQLGIGAGGAINGKLTMNQVFELPRDFEAGDLLSDPVGALRNVAGNTREIENSTTLTVGGNVGAAGNNAGGEMEFKINANPDQIRNSGAAAQFFTGDFAGAARSIGDGVTMSYKADTIQEHGIHATPELTIMGFGGGVEVQAQLQDRTTVGQGQATLTEIGDLLAQYGDQLVATSN